MGEHGAYGRPVSPAFSFSRVCSILAFMLVVRIVAPTTLQGTATITRINRGIYAAKGERKMENPC